MNRDPVKFVAGWVVIFVFNVLFWFAVVMVILHIVDTY